VPDGTTNSPAGRPNFSGSVTSSVPRENEASPSATATGQRFPRGAADLYDWDFPSRPRQ